ncbi:nucleotidyltransferase domain-containing protein [Mordavella massiliensis]|uniref:Nucleotidyltransferase domain-containing protein n=1 Tax=Mordavella massiliensis TaxID=1871024 RepID=A0A938XD34_9CLOT|nr:nucleotidyltransferase domain-containing protein [Mordavella massiliensis]MBM6949308.1 nucleotidyltransferase domain-containing protein [Mordavella massiliensis]
MSTAMNDLVHQYIELLSEIYGNHLKTVILYGSYARGDYTEDSDIDIMVLLDLSDIDIKKYRHELSGMTYDFNMDYDLDIRPIAKSKEHFDKWVGVYPFYSNIEKEGVKLFDAA